MINLRAKVVIARQGNRGRLLKAWQAQKLYFPKEV